jgi:phage gp45-like
MGIMIRQGAALDCNVCTVTGNGSHGINAEQSSVVTLISASVTGNAGAGINLTNLSSATFEGSGTVTNNSGLGDIVCNPHYTTVAGLPGAVVGRVVNCP